MIYVPYPEFTRCASVFDDFTLGRNRMYATCAVEKIQQPTIYRNLRKYEEMWKDSLNALKQYLIIMNLNWVNRGFTDSLVYHEMNNVPKLPYWLEFSDVLASHRGELVKNNPAYYERIFKDNVILDGVVYPDDVRFYT